MEDKEIGTSAIVAHTVETPEKEYTSILALVEGWWFEVIRWVWDKEKREYER